MRVTFVLPLADLSGGTRVVALQAGMLQERGHQVLVVSTPGIRPSWRERVRALIRGRGWIPARPLSPSHLESARLPRKVLDSFRPLRPEDLPEADLLIATWWRTVEWILPMPPEKGVKVHFLQGYEVDSGSRERIDAVLAQDLPRIAVSRWLSELAARGSQPVELAPNGVDSRLFDAPPRERREPPTVGLIYSTAPSKGVDLGLEAVRLARRRRPDLRLLAFSSGPLHPSLPLPPGSTFRLRPPQEEIPGLYAACDLWLWPCRQDGFGLPILEAMACRTPVVAAPAGAAPEILAEGGGILAPAAAAEPLAEAILRLLELDGGGWRALSDQARAVAEACGWERSGELFAAALARILAAARRPAGEPQGAAASPRPR